MEEITNQPQRSTQRSCTSPEEERSTRNQLYCQLKFYTLNGHLRPLLATLQKSLIFEKSMAGPRKLDMTDAQYLTKLILNPDTRDRCCLYYACQQGHHNIVDFFLCLHFVSGFSVARFPESVIMAQPFEKWFNVLLKQRNTFGTDLCTLIEYNECIMIGQDLQNLFKRDIQTARDVVNRLRSMLEEKPKSSTVSNFRVDEKTKLVKDCIHAKLNRILLELEEVKERVRTKKALPRLNYTESDDYTCDDDIDCVSLMSDDYDCESGALQDHMSGMYSFERCDHLLSYDEISKADQEEEMITDIETDKFEEVAFEGGWFLAAHI